MNRSDAQKAGLTTYSTGKPCRKGHTAPRYVSCGVCVECLRESRGSKLQLQNTALATRSASATLFAYVLHPDDHAAALAFCQALDLQRGRIPQAEPAIKPPTPRASATPEDVARFRELALGRAAVTPPAVDHVPQELRPYAK